MFIAHTKDTMSTIYLDAVKIRQQVFVNEQQVPYELEVDAYEAYTIHFVLYQALEIPVATVRLLPLEDGKVKVQRMAVLKEFRSQGFGQAIMEEAEKFATEQGFQKIILGAQLTAIPFYEQLGYQTVGEEFLDAGIAHLMMEKPLH